MKLLLSLVGLDSRFCDINFIEILLKLGALNTIYIAIITKKILTHYLMDVVEPREDSTITATESVDKYVY